MDPKLRDGLAVLLSLPAGATVSPESPLDDPNVTWDSMAIIGTIALADDQYGVILDGKELAMCRTVGGIEKLIERERAKS